MGDFLLEEQLLKEDEQRRSQKKENLAGFVDRIVSQIYQSPPESVKRLEGNQTPQQALWKCICKRYISHLLNDFSNHAEPFETI